MNQIKTREQIVEYIYRVLSEELARTDLSSFQSDSRLLEELGLDSTEILEMLMFLELKHELSIPEDALMNKDFETVRSVAQVMYDAQGIPKTEKGLEVYEDLKIHCVASCLGEIVKRNHQLDHRILYFAVWDAEVCTNYQYILSYHSDEISHQFYFDWYEKLYGMQVEEWYVRSDKKENNVNKLIDLVDNRMPDQHIMVMLDMYQLPERVNEFNKDPFPHYVMLAPTKNKDTWFMFDPDYRWEGVISKERILNAVRQPSVSGGYIFSDKEAKPSTPDVIRSYFEKSVVMDTNPVTDTLREIIESHLKGIDKKGQPLALKALS